MIPAFDGRFDYLRMKDEICDAMRRVCESGQLILGPEVEAFEQEWANYVGTRHAVGVNSGTDAISIALRALGIGAGDKVLTVANTAVPTIAAIVAAGATPQFVDIEPNHLLMDLEQVEACLTPRTRCIISVDLYGYPVDINQLRELTRRRGIHLVADCAQAHGTRLDDRHAGSVADIGCFSFYPTKNLGAMGDAGACVTNDPELARRMRRIRCYGFEGNRIALMDGVCSRLDEMQAAILRVKLRYLDKFVQRRRDLAAIYSHWLEGTALSLPLESHGRRHAYHQYVIQTDGRDDLIAELERHKIGYGIHYPVPVHLMPAYECLGYHPGDLPVTERAAQRILSLPLHPGLTEEQVAYVARVVLHWHMAAATEWCSADCELIR